MYDEYTSRLKNAPQDARNTFMIRAKETPEGRIDYVGFNIISIVNFVSAIMMLGMYAFYKTLPHSANVNAPKLSLFGIHTGIPGNDIFGIGIIGMAAIDFIYGIYSLFKAQDPIFSLDTQSRTINTNPTYTKSDRQQSIPIDNIRVFAYCKEGLRAEMAAIHAEAERETIDPNADKLKMAMEKAQKDLGSDGMSGETASFYAYSEDGTAYPIVDRAKMSLEASAKNLSYVCNVPMVYVKNKPEAGATADMDKILSGKNSVYTPRM